VLITSEALLAIHVTLRVPADSNPLTNFKSFCLFTESRDLSDYFMTWDQGVLGEPPLIIDNRYIRMTEATVFDFNFDFLCPKPAGFKFVWDEFFSRAVRGPSINLCHFFHLFSVIVRLPNGFKSIDYLL
jgi:hypothetical protein